VTKKVCVLVSGGFDSSALVADFLRQGYVVHPLYVRCGFHWEAGELHHLRRFLRAVAAPRLRPLSVVSMPMTGLLPHKHWAITGRGAPSASSSWDSVYLPARNLLLLTAAALYCSTHAVPACALAVLKGNPFADASPAYLKDLESVLRRSVKRAPRVLAPYRGLSKHAVLRRVPGLPVGLTFACLAPRGLKECHRCSKCEEKAQLAAAA
jgi:7-cyano-7-deazaguanine synthase